jgi:hypothetical protein
VPEKFRDGLHVALVSQLDVLELSVQPMTMENWLENQKLGRARIATDPYSEGLLRWLDHPSEENAIA